jgi:hypothetical protein
VHPLHGTLGLAQAKAEVLVDAVELIRLGLSGVSKTTAQIPPSLRPEIAIESFATAVWSNAALSWQFPFVALHTGGTLITATKHSRMTLLFRASENARARQTAPERLARAEFVRSAQRISTKQ